MPDNTASETFSFGMFPCLRTSPRGHEHNRRWVRIRAARAINNLQPRSAVNHDQRPQKPRRHALRSQVMILGEQFALFTPLIPLVRITEVNEGFRARNLLAP